MWVAGFDSVLEGHIMRCSMGARTHSTGHRDRPSLFPLEFFVLVFEVTPSSAGGTCSWPHAGGHSWLYRAQTYPPAY